MRRPSAADEAFRIYHEALLWYDRRIFKPKAAVFHMLKQSKKFCNLHISAALFLYLYIFQKNNKSEPVANRHKVRICLLCLSNIKKIFQLFQQVDSNSRTPKKVGSKPKRRERVYKRAAKARRDLFRKRRRSGMSEPVTFVKKVTASDIQLAATWWRRGESNPCPKTDSHELLRVQSLL